MQFLYPFFQCIDDVSHLYTQGLLFNYLFLQWLVDVLPVFFSTPFFISHFTKATALDFLDRTAISIEPSRLMKIPWGFFALPRGRFDRPPLDPT